MAPPPQNDASAGGQVHRQCSQAATHVSRSVPLALAKRWLGHGETHGPPVPACNTEPSTAIPVHDKCSWLWPQGAAGEVVAQPATNDKHRLVLCFKDKMPEPDDPHTPTTTGQKQGLPTNNLFFPFVFHVTLRYCKSTAL